MIVCGRRLSVIPVIVCGRRLSVIPAASDMMLQSEPSILLSIRPPSEENEHRVRKWLRLNKVYSMHVMHIPGRRIQWPIPPDWRGLETGRL